MEVRKYVRIILNIVIPVITVLVICFFVPKVLAFFLPFVIGWIVAMIANPLVRFLEKRVKIVRKHSSVLLIVGVLALVVAGLYMLASILIREMNGFLHDLPALYENSRGEILSAVERISSLFDFLPESLNTSFEQFMDSLGAVTGDFLQKHAASAGGAVARTLPDVLVNVIVALLSSYLFLTEHDRLVARVYKWLPDSTKRYLRLFRHDLRRVIGGYFLAQFKIMFVVAFVLFAGFLVLGVHYGLLWAVLIAILDFLPMFGTGTALIPWALVKLFAGEYAYAFGLAMIYVLSQVIRQVIQPKIVGDSMGLPPLTTLFFLFIGYKVRGLAGMFLAVPVGLIFINFYRYGAFDSFLENGRLLIHEIEALRKGEEKGRKNAGEGK